MLLNAISVFMKGLWFIIDWLSELPSGIERHRHEIETPHPPASPLSLIYYPSWDRAVGNREINDLPYVMYLPLAPCSLRLKSQIMSRSVTHAQFESKSPISIANQAVALTYKMSGGKFCTARKLRANGVGNEVRGLPTGPMMINGPLVGCSVGKVYAGHLF